MRKSILEPYRNEIAVWNAQGLSSAQIAAKLEKLTGTEVTDRSVRRFLKSNPSAPDEDFSDSSFVSDDTGKDNHFNVHPLPEAIMTDNNPNSDPITKPSQTQDEQVSHSSGLASDQTAQSSQPPPNPPPCDPEMEDIKKLVLKLLKRLDSMAAQRELLPGYMQHREPSSEYLSADLWDNPLVRLGHELVDFRWAIFSALIPASFLLGYLLNFRYLDIVIRMFGFAFVPAGIMLGLAIRRQNRVAQWSGYTVIAVLFIAFGWTLWFYYHLPIK